MGSSGDMKRRFKGVYKPGAHPQGPTPLDKAVGVVKKVMSKAKAALSDSATRERMKRPLPFPVPAKPAKKGK